MREFERNRVTQPEGGRQMTKQADALETDVNHIVARYMNNGELPVGRGQPQYGDFANVPDYLAAKSAIVQAQQQFDQLPAHVRKACDNDPAKFLDMTHDPERLEELRELGLIPEQEPASIHIDEPENKDGEVVRPDLKDGTAPEGETTPPEPTA